mgnify:CR=1 FL=1|tara:strand:- start:4864 stop:5031 length:168 start_codon:yes stop_codon:yes gene_type:complete
MAFNLDLIEIGFFIEFIYSFYLSIGFDRLVRVKPSLESEKGIDIAPSSFLLKVLI